MRVRSAGSTLLPMLDARSILQATIAIAGIAVGTAQASPERAEQQIRTALELDAHISRGGKLFAQHCARCHGSQARGNPETLVPSLAAQRRAYLIKQLADFSELDRTDASMHPVVAKAAVSHPQDWADMAAWLNALEPAPAPQTGDGTGTELGEAIYFEQCASCHEEDARGDDEGFIPSLRDQHYSYLLAQMRKLAAWHRSNIEPDLSRFIDSLDPEEMTGVADYLSRIRGPAVDRSRLDDDGTVSR